MSKLQIVDAQKMEKLLLHLQFNKTRQKGSHAFFRHDDVRITTVPYHPGKDLTRPVIRKILNDINLNIQEYHEMLKKL